MCWKSSLTSGFSQVKHLLISKLLQQVRKPRNTVRVILTHVHLVRGSTLCVRLSPYLPARGRTYMASQENDGLVSLPGQSLRPIVRSNAQNGANGIMGRPIRRHCRYGKFRLIVLQLNTVLSRSHIRIRCEWLSNLMYIRVVVPDDSVGSCTVTGRSNNICAIVIHITIARKPISL